MSGITTGQTGTNASTDSGQGTASLSDAFVAVTTGKISIRGPSQLVEAPEGSARLSVRRSSRVASSKSQSLQHSNSNSSAQDIVETLPGVKRKPGYVYQMLPPVFEEPGLSATPAGSYGNVSGLRDSTIPQLDPMAGTSTLVNRKRSASSAAPGSARQAPMAKHLASAADFSPTHFNEPVSEDHIPATSHSHHHPGPPSSYQHPDFPSPMKVEPLHEIGSQRLITPFSSPIPQHPLGQDTSPMVVQSPSPSRQRSASFRTRDSNAAWAAAQGLLPITETYKASGFVPATIVGGVTYSVHSPPKRQLTVPRSDVGRQLFGEYIGTRTQSQASPARQQPHQPAMHSVRPNDTFCMHILTHAQSGPQAQAHISAGTTQPGMHWSTKVPTQSTKGIVGRPIFLLTSS